MILIDVIKAIMYIFPFVKELFLGKKDKDGKVTPVGHNSKALNLLKQVLIMMAIVSVAINFILIQRLYAMGTLVVSLKKAVNTAQVAKDTDGSKDELSNKDTIGADPGPLPPAPKVPEPRVEQALPPRPEPSSTTALKFTRGSRHVVDPPVQPPPPAAPTVSANNDSAYQRLRRLEDIR